MPVSHSHKTIFVHIPKTAGSSIEKALQIHGSDNLGSLDLNQRILFGSRIWKLKSWCIRDKALQHLTANQIRRELGHQTFEQYFKFSVIRNPYDRVISDWFHMKRRFKDPDLTLEGYFKHYVMKSRKKLLKWALYDDHFMEQSQFIYRGSRCLVDFVAKFENLDHDWEVICNKLGIKSVLPQAMKSSYRLAYQEYFEPQTKKLCEELYRNDFQLFDYKF